MPTLAFVATLNNYTPEEVAHIRNGHDCIQYLVAGHEVGEQGTPHLQIYFQLKKQVRITTMHKWPGWERMAKIQPAKGSSQEASEYCKKDTNFFEVGQLVSPGRMGRRNELVGLKKAIEEVNRDDKFCDTYYDTAARFSKFIKERVQARDTQKQASSLREQFLSAVLRPWQTALMDMVLEDPNPRKIHWIWETVGKAGKSWMATYLATMHGATVLTAGKKVDMAYIYAQKPTKIVLFDLSRTTEPTDDKKGWLDGIYSLAEDLKNGRGVSTKYESKTVFFPTPHLIFFANFEPDMTKWSADRYFIKMI